MDGITLFSRVRRIYPQIQLIVLTCHKHFDYVHQMLQLGILDYLVKVNMKEEDLIQVLKKARLAIEQNRLARIGSSESRRNTLVKLFAGFHSPEPDYTAIGDGFASQGLTFSFPMKPVQLFLYYADPDTGFFDMEIRDILYFHDIFDPSLLQFVPFSDYCYLVLPAKNYKDASEQPGTKGMDGGADIFLTALKDGLEQTHSYLKTEMNLENSGTRLFAMQGRTVSDLAGLWDQLISTGKWRYRPFYEPDMPLFIEQDDFILDEGRPEESLRLEGLALKNKPDELVEYIKGPVYNLLNSRRFAPDKVRSFFSQWVPELLGGNSSLRNPPARRPGSQQVPEFSNLISLNEVCSRTIYLIKNNSNLGRLSHPDIKRALSYISDHLDNQLSLGTVAANIRLSTYYFSRLFHTEVGVPFHEYVTMQRVERAAALLKTTNDKVYEVADKVGIPNYRYFSMVFKKQLGMTPKEYKQNG